MNLKNTHNCELTKLERWSKFQLPYKWKSLGITVTVLSFLILLCAKLFDDKLIWLEDILKRILIIGLLVISISKDKYEDEMIASLRAKSYTLAFIFGVLYALIQPVIDDLIHTYVLESNRTNMFSYFQLLWYMLFVQIMFFEISKRNR
ncbi:MAG: hypothetical protein WA775_01530 [Psychroserpens sp.]|uniref:hypothetical protein n=1 Tax=Psychroserpens sp. TaxID=2020870 RepID=UPI003C726627